MLRHRAWTAAIFAFFGTGGLLLFGSHALHTRKRKARRAGNGARKEIIGMLTPAVEENGKSWSSTVLMYYEVIAGSPHEPLTRSIASDLERRGFIVFITVLSVEEEHLVQAENSADIRALYLDVTTVSISSLANSVFMY